MASGSLAEIQSGEAAAVESQSRADGFAALAGRRQGLREPPQRSVGSIPALRPHLRKTAQQIQLADPQVQRLQVRCGLRGTFGAASNLLPCGAVQVTHLMM